MTLKQRFSAFAATLLVAACLVGFGLYRLVEYGQFAPVSETGGAPRAAQHDSTVGSDVTNHKR